MSVDVVLDKISAHNSDVLGCVAKHGDVIHANLPEMYDLIDSAEIAEHAENMFALTDDLETDHDVFDQLFLEYANHSVFARRLDDGVLLLVNRPMERTQFKKMQVGVNLFLKPLKRALQGGDAGNGNIDQPTDPSGAFRKTNRKRWF